MIDTMLASIFASSSTTTTSASVVKLLMTLGIALVLGLLVSTVHMKSNRSKTPSQSFTLTLVMLPAIISVIIMLVGTNIASAFSLAGAFSIIRFRSTPGDPKDIAYVLLSMAVGLACGMGFILQAFIVALILCGIIALLEFFKFGGSKSAAKILKITIPENLDYQNAFEGVMKKYTLSCNINKVKTADLGSLYVLQYSIVMKDEVNEKNFIDELRCRNGNLNITLVLNVQAEDF
jgi:uncharacterized membrane protein YhiD involved in acid resistance